MEFEDLLQQAEQLNADIDSASELPRVECTFPQLVEKGQRLWSRTVGSNAAPQIGDAPGATPAAGKDACLLIRIRGLHEISGMKRGISMSCRIEIACRS